MNNLLTSLNNPFKRRYAYIILVLPLLFSACKSQKKLNKITAPTITTKCNLEHKNAKTLIANLKANEFSFERLNVKMNVDATIDSTSNSFNITLRILKDSIIWMSISKVGIEGARAFITKDSVKFFNKMNNTYFKGDFNYISNLLNTPLDFEILQSLLVGNSVTFYNEDEKLKPSIDDCYYLLGTIRKFKLRKIEKGKDLKEPVQTIYMQPETFKISRILFYDFNPDRVFDARFSDFTKIDSTQLFPTKLNYTIKTQKNISIDINYTKPRLGEEQSFPFKIPDSYERIVYKEQ